jgi:hypothetical protein
MGSPRSSELKGLLVDMTSGVGVRSPPRLILASATGAFGDDVVRGTALRAAGKFAWGIAPRDAGRLGSGIDSRDAGRLGSGIDSRDAGRLDPVPACCGKGTDSRDAGKLGIGMALLDAGKFKGRLGGGKGMGGIGGGPGGGPNPTWVAFGGLPSGVPAKVRPGSGGAIPKEGEGMASRGAGKLLMLRGRPGNSGSSRLSTTKAAAPPAKTWEGRCWGRPLAEKA